VTTPSIVFLQIARLAKQVFNSPILRDDLVICCAKSKLEPKQIKCSVPTWWNSVAEMINSVIYLRPALDKLVEMEHHNAVAKTWLRCLKLTKQEWDIMTRLQPILSVRFFIEHYYNAYFNNIYSTSSKLHSECHKNEYHYSTKSSWLFTYWLRS